MLIRIIVGIATFSDACKVRAIALAMPPPVSEWKSEMAGRSANRKTTLHRATNVWSCDVDRSIRTDRYLVAPDDFHSEAQV
jgi:hypothetical protein